MNVLSLFDGISCGRLALERANLPAERYDAFEIDKYAIAVSVPAVWAVRLIRKSMKNWKSSEKTSRNSTAQLSIFSESPMNTPVNTENFRR